MSSPNKTDRQISSFGDHIYDLSEQDQDKVKAMRAFAKKSDATNEADVKAMVDYWKEHKHALLTAIVDMEQAAANYIPSKKGKPDDIAIYKTYREALRNSKVLTTLSDDSSNPVWKLKDVDDMKTKVAKALTKYSAVKKEKVEAFITEMINAVQDYDGQRESKETLFALDSTTAISHSSAFTFVEITYNEWNAKVCGTNMKHFWDTSFSIGQITVTLDEDALIPPVYRRLAERYLENLI